MKEFRFAIGTDLITKNERIEVGVLGSVELVDGRWRAEIENPPHDQIVAEGDCEADTALKCVRKWLGLDRRSTDD